jgi:HK97 family phage portal protein
MSDHQFSPFTGNVFRRAELPAKKSFGPTQDFLRGTDSENQGGAVMVTPYAQSAWVYCAISILAQSVAQIPFRISSVKGGAAKRVRMLRGSSDPAHREFCRRNLGEDILESGDAVNLFKRPHPTMDAQMYFEMLVTWLSLRGEFFVLPLDGADQSVDLSERNPRIKRLLTLPPEMFWHVVQGYDLAAWRYTGSPLMSPLASQMLLPSEVIQSKQPNPYNYWRGLSPLAIAMTPAQTDYAGEQFQKGLWLNNADTGVIVTTEQILADDQRKAIESALRERKRKAGTPDRPLFLFGGAKIEKPTLSMMDMQFLETRKFLRKEIFAIFKVPELLAGFTEDVNDGGAGGSLDAQKASFVESTIGSLCTRIETAHASVVATFGPDLVGWFDIDSLPIMQAARRARWDTGTKMFAMGVPINDVNTNLDLGLPEYPWGKKSFLPFNLQEVSDAGLATELPSEDPNADGGSKIADGEKSNPFVRMTSLLSALRHSPAVDSPASKKGVNVVELWKKHVTARKASVNLFKGKVGKVLMKFRAKALAKLDEVHLQKDFAEISKKGLVDIIFSHLDFGHSLASELAPAQTVLLQSAGEELLAEVGADDPWKYPPKQVLEFLAGRKHEIMKTGQTVRNQLNTSLMEGVTNGETHLELAARVKSVFSDMTDGEAKRVARTEVNIGYETARDQASRDAGIEYKAWLGSHGPHPREGHQAVEDATIDSPIPIDEPFDVDTEDGITEQMMFPGDASLGATAANIINCNCTRLAAQKTGEDEKSLTFKIFGVGEMKFLKK